MTARRIYRPRTLADRRAFYPVGISAIASVVFILTLFFKAGGANFWWQAVWLTISGSAGLLGGVHLEFSDQTTLAKDRMFSPKGWVVFFVLAFGAIYGVLWICLSFRLVGHNHSSVWPVMWIGSIVWGAAAFAGVRCAFEKVARRR
jgi:hypothetical protein